MVGIIPIFAVATLAPDTLENLKGFRKRMNWFIENRYDLCGKVASMKTPGQGGRKLLSILPRDRLKRVLEKVLDEREFLSPYGIRSLSKFHQEHPYILKLNSHEYRVDYEPADSTLRLSGGNSNWRGPI